MKEKKEERNKTTHPRLRRLRCSGMALTLILTLARCRGPVDVAKESVEWHLRSHTEGGQALATVVGGAPEVLVARPGGTVLKLKDRKGFVKMALKHGRGSGRGSE